MIKLNLKINKESPDYLHKHFKDALKKEIISRKINPETRLPTGYELAETYGISYKTVEKALSELVREGILYRRPKKGTFVAKKSTRYSKSSIIRIGFSLPWIAVNNPTNLYYGSLMRGLRTNIPEKCTLVLTDYTGKINDKIDGMIFMAPRTWEKKRILELKKDSGWHIITLGASFRDTDIEYVDSANIQGTKEAVRYLVRLGHKRIGFISALSDTTNTIDRTRGYIEAIKENDLPLDRLLFSEINHTKESRIDIGFHEIERLLALPKKPTAILSARYDLTLGVIRYLSSKNVKIPDDLSLISFDDVEPLSTMKPPITTIKQDIFKMGKIALSKLWKKITLNTKEKIEVLVKTELIIRESCRSVKKEGSNG